VEGGAADALAQLAVIASGAKVTIIAHCLIQRMNAPALWQAGIVGAGIVVVTVELDITITLTADAHFTNSALVAVVARFPVD